MVSFYDYPSALARFAQRPLAAGQVSTPADRNLGPLRRRRLGARLPRPSHIPSGRPANDPRQAGQAPDREPSGRDDPAPFQARLDEAAENARRTGDGVGLVIVNIDRFKDINDGFGRGMGDALLDAFAVQLRIAFDGAGFATRLGGDEFAVILPGADDPQALLQPVKALYRLLREPVECGGKSFTICASVGAALLSDDDDAAQWLRDAGIALSQARQAGNQAVVFEPRMRRDAETKAERLQDIRAALEADEFVLHYQPIVDLHAGRVAGFEALMRWRRADGRVLSPADFMVALEDPDLSLKLGELALDRALMQMRAWLDQGVDFGRVAINAACAQFCRGDLAQTVLARLDHWRVPASRLTLEITESVYMCGCSARVGDAVKALHDAGVAIALDDFGTGYASLANLRQFPIDHLKIDKSFVQNLEDDAIVRAVISMGKGMGMTIVAEGVERPEQLHRLAGYGCDRIQGYHFSKPMPPAEAARYLGEFGQAGYSRTA